MPGLTSGATYEQELLDAYTRGAKVSPISTKEANAALGLYRLPASVAGYGSKKYRQTIDKSPLSVRIVKALLPKNAPDIDINRFAARIVLANQGANPTTPTPGAGGGSGTPGGSGMPPGDYGASGTAGANGPSTRGGWLANMLAAAMARAAQSRPAQRPATRVMPKTATGTRNTPLRRTATAAPKSASTRTPLRVAPRTATGTRNTPTPVKAAPTTTTRRTTTMRRPSAVQLSRMR